MGHVPAGPVPQEGPGDDVPRREHRGAGADPAAVARRGEALAARFLERRGADVLGRNVRAGGGEIDLVVRIGGELAAVEVKTATRGDPSVNFTSEKERRVRRAAQALAPPVHRVDLVTVQVGDDGVTFRWHPDPLPSQGEVARAGGSGRWGADVRERPT